MSFKAKRYVKLPLPERKDQIITPGGEAYDPLRPQQRILFELTKVGEEGALVFTCFDGQRFFTKPLLELPDCYIIPPPEEKVTWRLPQAIEGEGNPPDEHPLFARMIWDGVDAFLRNHIVLRDERWYTYLTAWTVATWFQDAPLPSSPYPFFLGLKNSGKTTALFTLGELCFRAKTLIGISGAAIRTNVRLLHPTLLIDEQDLTDPEKRIELHALFLCYKPGQSVERKEPRAKGWDQLVMDPAFCFKAAAGRKPPEQNIEDRFVIINMTRAKPPKRLRSRESQEAGVELRTQLLELRLRHFDEAKRIDEWEVPGVTDDRVEELFLPIYGISKLFAGKDEQSVILELAREAVVEMEERAKMTEERAVVSVIVKLKDEIDRYGFLPTSRILEVINAERPEGMEMSRLELAQILDRLGFKRRQAKYAGGKNLICATIEGRLLEFYRQHFGLTEEGRDKVEDSRT